jgi:zinc/manganese transport system substrate-binding protein
VAILGPVAILVAACSAGPTPDPSLGQKAIVVTYPILGAVVEDLVGDAADVVVLMPNGADPHQWQPSARDIESVMRADLLVENGLDLEAGMATVLEQAEAAGVPRFVVGDHVTVRTVDEDAGTEPGHSDHAHGARDPHLWMDPLTMRQAADALGPVLAGLGIAVGDRVAEEGARLEALDSELRTILAAVPEPKRKLVTGHESLGYFADRYGFTAIGAIIPGLSSQGEPSAADLAALSEEIRAAGVEAIFVEVGTPVQVAEAIAGETGVRVVELNTHVLPADGSYFTFMRDLATLVADNLE